MCVEPSKPPVPSKLIQLVSADGIRSERFTSVPVTTREWRTPFVARRTAPLSESAELPTGSNIKERLYRHFGRFNFNVELWEEVVEEHKCPPSVRKDAVEAVISDLTAQARRNASESVVNRTNGHDHLAVNREATAQALTNVVIKLKQLVKGK